MRRVQLGSSGLEVGALGFGAWGLSGDYGVANDRESIAALRRTLELGANLIDTADEYGSGGNELLVGRALAGRRAEAVVATKTGIVHGPDGAVGVCGRPDYVRAALDRSLMRLGIDTIDLFYLHRVDPEVPIEETVGAMSDLVAAGKARFIGLSEAGPETIRRANAIHSLAAIQSEYSLWTRTPERDVLPIVRELGIGFVAFSPLGRGFLAGGVDSTGDLGPDDFRRRSPRFSDENMRVNRKLVAPLRRIAADRGATLAQVALAWLLERDVVPIPGTRHAERVDENVQATEVLLTPDERDQLDRAFRPGVAAGARYPEELEVLTGR